MAERYHVEFAGARTLIVETPAGEWPQFNAARVAAIEHIEEVLAEAQDALDTLRRSGCYADYSIRQADSDRDPESRDVRFVPQEDAEDSFKLTAPSCR